MRALELQITVYLEDTEATGAVHHSAFLRYCARSRTELYAAEGYSQGLLQEEGWFFVVYEMDLKFRGPARLHDHLQVRTEARRASPYRMRFRHTIGRKGEAPLFEADADVVSIGTEGALKPMPDGLLSEPA